MNTLFWSLCASLIAVALSFLLWPLWRKTLPVDASSADNQANLGLAKVRLVELKQQLADGALDQAAYQAQYDELQKTLLDDWQEANAQPQADTESGRWLTWLLIWLVPLVTLTLYAALGDPDAMQKQQMQLAEQQAVQQQQALVDSLLQRYRQQPDNLELAVELANAYQQLGDYPRAVMIFGPLSKRYPDHQGIRAGLVDSLVDMAHALSLQSDGQLSTEAVKMVQKALELSPNHQKALYLSGWAHFQANEFDGAIADWQRVMQQMSSDHVGMPQMQQLIAEAKAKQTQAQANPGLQIAVEVKIDPALQAQMDKNATLFVYAQALNGPKMPICIQRMRAADLPAKLTLDDRNALDPAVRMADQTQLKLLARVSKSGDAMPKSGDLLGSVEVKLPLGDQTVGITINQTVP